MIEIPVLVSIHSCARRDDDTEEPISLMTSGTLMLDEEKLRVLRENGCDRISINPQTMNDHTLRVIGRAHTARQVEEAYAMAREAGIHHINMDVIAGLPGETLADFIRMMEQQAAADDRTTAKILGDIGGKGDVIGVA